MNFTLKTMHPYFSVDTGDSSGSDDKDDDEPERSAKRARTNSRKVRNLHVERMGELTQDFSAIIGSLGTLENSSQANELTKLEKDLKLKESLKVSMEMYRERNDCPSFIGQFLEDELKNIVSKLTKDSQSEAFLYLLLFLLVKMWCSFKYFQL